MHSTLKGKHGHIADIISTLTRKEYPEIEVPELPIRPPLPAMPPAPAQEATRAIREAWTAECDNIRAAYSLAVEDYKLTFMEVKAIRDERIRHKETIEKEIKQDQDTEAKIVGDLWNEIDATLQDRVKGFEGHADVHTGNDVIKLVKAIQKAYRQETIVHKDNTQLDLVRSFTNFRMRDRETEVEYAERLLTLLDDMVSAGGPPPTDKQIALQYIRGLSNKFYGKLKQKYADDTQANKGKGLPDAYPDTLPNASTAVQGWRQTPEFEEKVAPSEGATALVTVATEEEDHLVFAATGKGGKKSHRNQPKAKDLGKPSSNSRSAGAKREPDDDCPLCHGAFNEEGKKHWRTACPLANLTSEDLAHIKKQINPAVGGSGKKQSHITGMTIGASEPASMYQFTFPTMSPRPRAKFPVIIDSGSTLCVANHRSFIKNLRIGNIIEADTIAGASSVSMEQYADSPIFGDNCTYNERSPVGILCETWVKWNFHYVTEPIPEEEMPRPYLWIEVYFHTIDRTIRFHYHTRGNQEKAVYLADFEPYINDGSITAAMQNPFVSLVRSIPSRQRTRIDMVPEVVENLGFPGKQSIITAYKSGCIEHLPVTAEDVRIHVEETGLTKSEPELKGKTVHLRGASLELPKLLRDREVILWADIYYLHGTAFLAVVVQPTFFGIADHLGGTGARQTANLKESVLKVIAFVQARDWKPKYFVCDAEKGLAKISPDIDATGTLFYPQPKGEGTPILDVRIRYAKERARTIEASMKFSLSQPFVPWLGIHAFQVTNWSPTRSNDMWTNPYLEFHGEKLDYQKYCAVACFQYVHTHETDNITRNSMKFRTIPAIALTPNMRTGTWNFMNLLTMKPISRRAFTVMPIPNHWLTVLNDLAIKSPPKRDIGASADDNIQLADLGPDVQDLIADEIPDPWPPPAYQRDPDNIPDIEPVLPAALESDFNAEIAPSQLANLVTERRYIGNEWKVNATEVCYSSLPSNPEFAATIERVFSINYTPKRARELFGLEADASITDELQNMLDKKVWHGVLRSSLSKRERKRIIRCSIFLKEKYSPEGVRQRLKARLVAGGHQQDRSLYSQEDITSPTVSINALFCILDIAAKERRHILSFDIGAAYLHAELTGVDVYMELDALTSALLVKMLPDEYSQFIDENGKILVKLDKSLYGLVESAKNWYTHIKSFLISLGYIVNPLEPCVFNKITESGVQCTIAIYVDDAIATCADEHELDLLATALESEFKELNINRGLYHDFLGMKLDFSTLGICHITMPKSIEDLLLANPHITTSRKVPAGLDLFIIDDSSPPLDDKERAWFHSTVAALLFISTRVRKDISVAVGFLCTRVLRSTRQDSDKLDHLLKYLHGTKDLGLTLGGEHSGYISIYVYVDASYGIHDDGKSHSGIVASLGRGTVLSRSFKTKTVPKSSAEAELITASDGAATAIWLREFLKHQGYDLQSAVLREDNQAAIHLINHGRPTSERTRHIKIRYFFIKQFVDSGELEIEYCPTDQMIADILTKPLQGDLFLRLRDLLLGRTSL